MPDEHFLTLINIGGGVASEQWAEALLVVLENMTNPNTDEKASRKIVTEVVFKPCAGGEFDVTVNTRTKLGPVVSFSTRIVIGKQNGRNVAREYNQLSFDFDAEASHLQAVKQPTGEQTGEKI